VARWGTAGFNASSDAAANMITPLRSRTRVGIGLGQGGIGLGQGVEESSISYIYVVRKSRVFMCTVIYPQRSAFGFSLSLFPLLVLLKRTSPYASNPCVLFTASYELQHLQLQRGKDAPDESEGGNGLSAALVREVGSHDWTYCLNPCLGLINIVK
jgi:hypothetical protein